ncbi:proteasome maturation protein [Sporothrix brasiliensis 5110]|uniref:Proteasome maturation protein n=1 Tax=Sporothrix brasiliensis 5110 TaxID=1398154 RepID=A0A0C2IZV7_9PEZI|nr:proteasome maturation protein [Sporothrix brasiliensis 5110]KIH92280.1 proteasome maturation protein [Sporothrix brasiliensis 5110]
MSLRIVPVDAHADSFSHVASRERGAPSAPGVHDLMRHGVGPKVAAPSADLSSKAAATGAAAPQLDSAHPLEARLKQWEVTRENMRMEMLRRTYGVAEPVRRGMELKITRDGEWRPLALGSAGPGSALLPSVHEDILLGRDTTVDWEDIYTGEESRAVPTFHEEMERKLRM